MPFCSYCKKSYEIPRGMTMVMTDGNVNYFCSSKCRKNFLLKRRKVRWVIKGEENKATLKLKQEMREAREVESASLKKK